MRWVNCLKTLNKLTMCLPGKTPSAPSVGDCRGPCCAGELEPATLSITAIPLVTPVPSATTIQSINATPPVLTTQSSADVFSADTLSPTATTQHPAKCPISILSVPHSLFTFQVQAPGMAPAFKNTVLQDCTNTMGGQLPLPQTNHPENDGSELQKRVSLVTRQRG